jgi:DNA invertase Pin-like site-specific DNA recombinase
MTAYISYLRVSTDRQERSGLGLEGQEATIQAFLKPGDVVLARYVETESGDKDDRPELAKAIRKAKRTGSILLVSTLDRLSRGVAFTAALIREMGDNIKVADAPNDSVFVLHIKASVAEEERRKISERTRAALAAAKARGVVLGGFRGLPGSGMPAACIGGAAASAAVRSAKATKVAYELAGTVRELQESGVTSLNGLSAALNDRHVATPRGNGTWTATAVRRLLARLEQDGAD